MTKKHFIAIAKLLKNKRLAIQQLTNPTTIKGTENIITNIENGLIDIFIDDNPRFDVGNVNYSFIQYLLSLKKDNDSDTLGKYRLFANS